MAEEATMIIGVSGSGKTNFALTWPTPGLIWDLENKARDALPGRLTGWKVKALQEPIILEALEMHTREAGVVVTSETRPCVWRDFCVDLNDRYNAQIHALKELEGDEYPAPTRDWGELSRRAEEKGMTLYRTAILDSWSELCIVMDNDLHYLKARLGLPTSLEDYGILNAKYKVFIPIFKGLPFEHVVLVAHEEPSKHELLGTISYTPWTVGQSIRPIMSKDFSNVYRTEVALNAGVPVYQVYTRAYGSMFPIGKSRHSWALPVICPQDWKKMDQVTREATTKLNDGGGEDAADTSR